MTQLDLQQRLEQALEEAAYYKPKYLDSQKAVSEHWQTIQKLENQRDSLQQQVNALAGEVISLNNHLKLSVEVAEKIWWMLAIGGYKEDQNGSEQDKLLYAASKARKIIVETPATDAIKRQWMAEALAAVPSVCDGNEQKAFEIYAKEQRLDLQQHPWHYLFLDDKTNTARNAWRECLNYVSAQLRQPEEKDHE